MVDKAKIAEYADKVYAYAVKRTWSREEAGELSQEILFTLVRELPKLREEERFEPWLWGVAGNVARAFRRRMGKQRAMYFYNVPLEAIQDEIYAEEAADDEAIYGLLREKIAMLSAMYREIILLYYYDGLSTRQIAQKLQIPEGTVAWRLAEARKKIKKECADMEERALKPVRLRLDITGNGEYDGGMIPFPSAYIDDALSQNILFCCYEQPRTIEELSKLCGVPAFYVEDRMENLVKREAVIEPSKGKYRTNFLIWTDEYGIYCEKHGREAMMPVMASVLEALKRIAREAGKIDFYRAEKSDNELFYLYGVMAFSCLSERYCKEPYIPYKSRYDGYDWDYVGYMETGLHRRSGVGVCCCSNQGSRGSYMHLIYTFSGFRWRPMMQDGGVNVCQDILERGRTEDVDMAARLVQDGYIHRREEGHFLVTIPAFTKAQKEQFNQIVEQHLAPLAQEYFVCVSNFLKGYEKLFPKHLSDVIVRMRRQMYFEMYDVIAAYAQESGEGPGLKEGSVCDVLIQYK